MTKRVDRRLSCPVTALEREMTNQEDNWQPFRLAFETLLSLPFVLSYAFISSRQHTSIFLAIWLDRSWAFQLAVVASVEYFFLN